MIERILVVDDDQSLREFLTITLGRDGFEVVAASSGAEALRAMTEAPADLALVDLKMPGMDGLETLRRLKELERDRGGGDRHRLRHDRDRDPGPEGRRLRLPDQAVQGRRAASWWCGRRSRSGGFAGRTSGSGARSSSATPWATWSARARKVQELFSTISRLAESRATVLLTGESGTGKTLLAKTIHFNSSRKNGPFVGVNCAAIPNELMESELFGHVRGAFTGAIANKQGLFETADGGTLLLDEISEMSTHLQAKLLRVLEDREIRPVGGTKPVRVEVRIVAATNRDLAQAMARGAFREDLFYRLNVISVALPSLRERREDIPLLVQPLPPEVHRAGGRARQGPLARGADVPRGLRVAREHPGAGERDRAGGHPRVGPDPPAREPARVAAPAPHQPDAFHVDFPPDGARPRQADGADRAGPASGGPWTASTASRAGRLSSSAPASDRSATASRSTG